MALLNYKKKEINAKIVYYGPGLSGKTTNIQFIHTKLRPDHRGKLMTLATQTDRTLFFDFLPVELGEIRGLKTRFQLYTVPGQVFYNATRKLVLKNVDGVVFIADSDPAHLADNIESLKNLETNLSFHGRDIKEIPLVIQYNKRDLPTAMTIADLQAKLNIYNAPICEASAGTGGKGVLETLTLISKLVLQRLRDSQNVTRVADDAPDGTEPDPGMVAPPEEVAAPAAKATPSAAKSISLKPAAKPVAVVEESFEEPDILEEEIEVELEEEILTSPAVKAAPKATAPVTIAASASKGSAKIEFKKVVASQPAGNGIDLTLAFASGDQEVNVTVHLEIRAK